MDKAGDIGESDRTWLLLEFPKNGGPSLRLEGIFSSEAEAVEAAVRYADRCGGLDDMDARTTVHEALEAGRRRFIVAKATSKLKFESEIVVRLVDEDEVRPVDEDEPEDWLISCNLEGQNGHTEAR